MPLTTRTLRNAGAPLTAPDGTVLARVALSFTLVDESGAPQDVWDAVTFEHVLGSVSVTTDANGEFSVNLWPNSRGDRTSRYACVIDSAYATAFTGSVDASADPLEWIDFMLAGEPLTPEGLSALQRALDAAADAEAAQLAIDDRIYPGSYTADPTTRPSGAACQDGDVALVSGATKQFTGGVWAIAAGPSTADLANSSDSTKGTSLLGHRGQSVYTFLNQIGPRRLSKWHKGGVRSKTIACVGDSTVLQLFTGGAITTGDPSSVSAPARYSGELPGVTFLNFGSNGNTLASFIANPAATRGFNAVVAAAPNLIYLSYLINDVRQGATSLAQAITLLETAINMLLNALPGTDIVLVMPNSFTTNDVGGFNYVTANGVFSGMTVAEAAQAATDILRNAYRSVADRWPNVLLFDSQANVFPDTCVASTATTLMTDQIHPNVTAQRIRLDMLVQDVIGASAIERMNNGYGLGVFNVMRAAMAREFNLGRALDAVSAQGVRLAPTAYPQIVLNGDYDLIVAGFASGAVTAGQVSLQVNQFVSGGIFTEPGTLGGGLQVDDVVVQISSAGVFACLLNNVSGTKNTTALNITSGFGASSPNALVAQAAGDPVLIYRHKYANSANAKAIAVQSQYKARAVYRVAAAGLNTITLVPTNQGPKDVQWTPRAGHVLSFSDIADITLTSSMSLEWNSSGSQLTIRQTGTDFTTTTNRLCQIAATGSNVAETMLAQPIRFDLDGTVVDGTYNRYFTRSGRYRNMVAYLDTPDATNPTTVVVRTILNGSLALVATVTFAAGQNVGTVAYTFSSEIPVAAGVRVAFVVTRGGSGVAGLHLAFEQ
jgi:lysophospholipase L1-like esterase